MLALEIDLYLIRRYTFFLLAGVVAMMGCSRNAERGFVATHDDGVQVLTPEVARAALIAMITKDHSDDNLYTTRLARLRTDAIIEEEGGIVAIGRWRCDMKGLTFGLDLSGDQYVLAIHGKFEFVDGSWRASVTGVTQS
jgi:hypothetical protein